MGLPVLPPVISMEVGSLKSDYKTSDNIIELYGDNTDKKGRLLIGKITFEFSEETLLSINGCRKRYIVYNPLRTDGYYKWRLILTPEEDKILQISSIGERRAINGFELFRLSI
jgi:hypothetical protein